ncbi:MAG TPA: adenylate/guanylate cyclase domain-containing protein, partial [Chitinophagaceae bacterium]|nr:adenylate/guanylate cyclase domain-containing protein [Chitinophagaceae bacterium]
HAEARLFHDVTVMFTDFVNFTGVGEKLAPQALVSELHTCFMNFDRIIEKHGLEKIKTIGDAYLAVGGLPLRDVAHAENVLKASLEIRQYMEERQAALQEKTFRIRIGIHTGSVVAGIVGVKKFAYDIWGDTVNTAARMEQNSEAGRINVSETTYEITKEQFHFSFRGDLDVKNKGKMKMYFLETS